MRRNRGNFTFSNTPVVKFNRSKFDLSYGHTTSMNVGELIPFHIQEVYPGDSFSETATFVDRVSSAFLRPAFGNLIRDVFYFFVPNRLLLDDWDTLIANTNKRSAWANTTVITAPQIESSVSSTPTTINRKHVLAYMGGVPVGERIDSAQDSNFHAVSQLPARAFALIYNDWFRDENFTDPLDIPKGDASAEFTFSTSAPASNLNISNSVRVGSSPNAWCGLVPFMTKRPDYFRACLPSPQKGTAITIPLLGYAPVLASVDTDVNLNRTSGPLTWGEIDSGLLSPINAPNGTTATLQALVTGGSGSPELFETEYSQTQPGVGIRKIAPMNLYASLTGVSATDVNSLRFAFQAQKMLEADARGGTRLTEYIASHFGISNLDSRMDRPEFLNGYSQPLNIQQVAQTSQATTDSPLGGLGAYSHSVSNGGYSKSFTEHGFVIGVTCIRQMHTYQESIKRFWFKKNRYDFYDPLFAHIGEQPVYTKELTFRANDDTIFGYNEYGADLRWNPSRVSGQLSSNATDSLDIWTFADKYENAPTLSEQFVNETSAYVDRALAVSSSAMDQFISDIWINSSAVREMPTYGNPGLIDHTTTK